ncbi:peptidyl-prolyl cis-trans isomerase [Parasphingopyxis marina]|uniref:Parvulin-like PPIase n=1 Tax=Parasphingopyxis marina TaxID=2761622 RepID=A0A842HZ36_9SPHN|nr:peptidyl-prolyl cis-trans isomerase [Parasphingopyxis marina]MBC2777619.1 peptidyl-prolyl cis-trans isomerase [Parasphingopyxis marina]
MITFFRRLFNTKLGVVIAMLFVALIALAFGLADISAPGGMFSGGGTTVASVNGTDVDEDRVALMAQRALDNARTEQPNANMGDFIDSGALNDVIDQYVRSEALRMFANDHGILVSDDLVNAAIRDIPAFQGLTGEFDEPSFRQVIAAQGLSEAEVREDLARQALLRVLMGPLGASPHVTLTVARPYASLLPEERSGQVAAIPSSAIPEGNPPTAAEINAFYQDNIDRYTLPDRRAVRYAVFTRTSIDIPAPSEEDIRAYYEDNDERYAGSETRSFQQIILADEADARAFYQAVNGGADFAAQAAQRGFAAGSLNVSGQTQDAFQRTTSQDIAAAAFRANEGALLQPMRSGLGWHVIRVSDIVTRGATPLGNVRPEIVATLREEATVAALGAYYEEIESAIEDGASFEEVIEAKDLTIQSTPLLTSAGLAPDQPGYRPTADLQPILQLAFTLGEGDDPELVQLEENQRYALVQVTRVASRAPRALASIQPAVTRDFLLDRQARRAREIADGIVARVNAGQSLAEAMQEVEIDLPRPLPARATRQAVSRPDANIPEPVRLMFRMAENTAKLIRLPLDQGWYVVVLEAIESDEDRVTPEMVRRTAEQFEGVTGEEYSEQFINAVLVDYPVTRNEEAIAALAERLRTGRAN